MGLQRFRVYVDRDLVPNWFGRKDIGVCTRADPARLRRFALYER